MKYVLSFVAAFTIVAGVAAFLRVRGGPPADGGAHSAPAAAMQPANEPLKSKANKPAETPVPQTSGVTDLANKTDPVSGAVITDADAFTAEWKGFKAHFASADTLATYNKMPLRYSAALGLAMDGPDDVHPADIANAKLPTLPEECVFCGQELDAEGDVYIVHRNYKFFFG